MKQKITIHWDFNDGTELSYGEGLKQVGDFNTHCLDFFNSRNNAVVVKRDGSSISVRDLLDNESEHTVKEIRSTHNLHKMLVSGAFQWKKSEDDNEEN